MSPPAVAEPLGLGILPLWDEPGGRSPLRLPEPAEAEPSAAPGGPGDDLDGSHAPLTLERAVTDSWRRLRSGFATACLLCGGAVQPRWSASAGVVGGRCGSCGTAVE